MPKQTTRSSPSSSSRRRPNTRAAARAARRQTHAPYPPRQSTSPGPSTPMAAPALSRDRIIDMYSIFEPNGQLPDEFRSCIYGGYIDPHLSEHANLRGRFYNILVQLISEHVVQHPDLYGRLVSTVPEDIPRLAAIEKQLQRDLWPPLQQQNLDTSLRQRTLEIRQITDGNPRNFRVNLYATGVMLQVMDSIVELDSSIHDPVQQHREVLQAAVEQVVAQPEDVLAALLSSIQAIVLKLREAAAYDQAHRLAEAIRFVPGGAGGRA